MTQCRNRLEKRLEIIHIGSKVRHHHVVEGLVHGDLFACDREEVEIGMASSSGGEHFDADVYAHPRLGSRDASRSPRPQPISITLWPGGMMDL
jgi:hypothetical protein